MDEYSVERLEQLDDLGEVMEIGEDWGVDFEGLDCEESFKDRLILHYLKQTDNQYFKMEDQALGKMKEGQRKKTEAIIELLNKVRKSLGTCLKPVSSILKAGNMSQDLNSDFDNHIEELENKECCVVITGETSSGKSSLLNLVLGTDILPTHTLSCTFIICKLKYWESYRSTVRYEDGTVKDFQYSDQHDAKEKLNGLIFEKNIQARECRSDITEMDIYLPAELLKSGITIVDTPGFGENRELNNRVVKFLASTSITGFIYIIRTDTAGGIQEDRLIEFLQEIKKSRSVGSMSKSTEDVSADAALFICNRWDIIREEQKERVRKNAISKLSDAWPGFRETQVIFFSTEEAAQHAAIDRDYITKELAVLLKRLVKLSQTALDQRIKQHYRWLKKILSQTTSHVTSMLRQINKSDEDLNKKFHETKIKIDRLNNTSKQTISDLKGLIGRERGILMEKIKSFLKRPELKAEIKAIKLDLTSSFRRGSVVSLATLPSDGTLNKQSQPSVYEAMALRLLIDEIDRWIRENNHDTKMADNLNKVVNFQLEGLQLEMDAIKDEMSDGASIASHSSCSTLPDDDFFDILYTVKRLRRKKIVQKLEHIVDEAPNRRLQPKVLVARAILSALAAVKVPVRRQSTYSQDPNTYVRERAIKYIDSLLNNGTTLEQLCDRYTESLRHLVETISDNIPMFISTNHELMEEISKGRQLKIENKETLTTTINQLGSVKELLRGFECVYVKDLRTSSVTLEPILPVKDWLSRSSRESIEQYLNNTEKSRPINAVCFCARFGTVSLQSGESNIISRTCNKRLDVDEIFTETSRLKHIKHENVAEFIGMVRQDEEPVLIFLGHLNPIKRYLSKPHIMDIQTLTVNIITGTVNGLQALHRGELVHMELSPLTIMIDVDTEKVMLMGGCLPRQLSFSENNDTEAIGELSFLSPDVLRGQMYTKADDIYSLACLIYNIVFAENPFHKQLTMNRAEFIETVNPEAMVTIDDNWPPQLRQLLTTCLFTSRENRATINDVQSLVSQIDFKPLVCNKRATRRRPVRRTNTRTSPDINGVNSGFVYKL